MSNATIPQGTDQTEDIDGKCNEVKCALISGGTSGVGAATAIELARAGAESVVVVGRDQTKGHEVCETIREFGTFATLIEADLSGPAGPENIFRRLESEHLLPDTLVNAAGITTRASVLDVEYKTFDELNAVNVRAPLFLIQEFASRLLPTKAKGTIVNVLSFAMYGGAPDIGIYAMTKAALAVLTKNAAYMFQGKNIRVNGLNIGWTFTPGEDAVMQLSHGAAAGWEETYSDQLPLGRLLRPEEVAKTIRFLATDISFPMTGSVVDFDQISHGVGEWPPPPTIDPSAKS